MRGRNKAYHKHHINTGKFKKNLLHLCFVVPFLKVLNLSEGLFQVAQCIIFLQYNKAQKLQSKAGFGWAGRKTIRERQIIEDESFSSCRNDRGIQRDSVEPNAASGLTPQGLEYPHKWHALCVIRNPSPSCVWVPGDPWVQGTDLSWQQWFLLVCTDLVSRSSLQGESKVLSFCASVSLRVN